MKLLDPVLELNPLNDLGQSVFHETRPYMRARAGLGEALWATGDRDAAIENFKEMLELNPGDNQGIRYVLAAKLLDMGNIVDLKALLEMYADDYSADIQYTRALIAFSEGADNADDIAEEAYQTNKHVPAILSAKKSLYKWEPISRWAEKMKRLAMSKYLGAHGRKHQVRLTGSVR